MITTSDFKTGLTIEFNNDVYTIVYFQHVKPGKGAAFVRTKLKSFKSGNTLEHTFKAGEKLKQAMIEYHEMQYLYSTGTEYFFMDNQSFDQVPIPANLLGENIDLLKDSMVIRVMYYEGSIIGVEFPNFVELKVVQTEPGFRGDTATGASKPATMETGAVIQVPLFIEIGDVLQIDTRTRSYLKRA